MQRLFIVGGFSALLFLAGLLAGSAVMAVGDHDQGLALSSGRQADFIDPATSDVPKTGIARLPFMTVSRENVTQDGDSFLSDKTSIADDFESGNQAELHTIPDSRHYRDALSLVRSVFPDADEGTAEAWAGAYADTDLAALAFVLEQKRQLSGSLSVGGIAGFPEESLLSSARFADSATPVATAISAVKSNLRGTWSIGYRRTVVLPEAVADPDEMPAELRQQIRSTMLRCFDSGKTVSSPTATHVALPASDGSLMFLLENNQLTRRGDFQLLSDRRLGLITHGGTFALADSPTIPEAAIGVRITKSGEIQYSDPAGEFVTAGKVRILSVIELGRLKTDDGVLFTMGPEDRGLGLTPAETDLMTNRLEISNVDHEEEHRVLEHLISLSR